MTEIQKRLFEDLCLLRDILDKNEISYYLAYGTLLGAVRHQGFIPWDDDIDIYVDIKDIPLLRETFEKENCRLKFHDYTTHLDYPYSIPKVVDEDTILKEKVFEHLNYECGVYIDVFPLIEIPDSLIRKYTMESLRYYYYGLVKYYNLKQTKLLALHHVIKKFINLNKVQYNMEKNLRSPKRKGHKVTDPLAFESRLEYPKEFFIETKELFFEGEPFKVPSNYEGYLRSTYGDFLQLPPENERVPKHDFYFKILK